jgi:GNAT superfamily N-acetyltransferase/catechol 2,3-dioxygenase-like lactoylglutathione lyase family enzyme
MGQGAAQYRIRLARLDELPRLRDIEDRAGTMFSGLGLIEEALDVSYPPEELRRLIGLRQVWVAFEADDVPVGMVIASVRDGSAHIDEMDVLPAHGGRGLGTLMLDQACAWAQAQGYSAVTLSTFRDVPWNGPFYTKNGFRALPSSEWTSTMRAIREKEAEHGRLRVEARVFMRRELERHPLGGRLQVRVARQTGRLDEIVTFYREGLGLAQIDHFTGHAGYDGVMLELPGTGAHLDFTATEHSSPPLPHLEDLLVLYVGDQRTVDELVARLAVAPISSENPYSDQVGVTVCDPDGFRVVLVGQTWP